MRATKRFGNKKGQVAVAMLLLFVASLIFYAVMFPELVNIIEGVKNQTTDATIVLIYDTLPFALGFMLLLGVILSIAAITR